MESKMRNGLNGKVLETVIALPELPGFQDMGRIGKSRIKIYTTKNSRGVVQSYCGVEFDMGDGSILTRYPDDFGLFVQPSTLIKRATEKALHIVHAETLAQFDALKARALAHYGVGV